MEVVEAIRKYTQHQDNIALEMGVSRIYLNNILKGKYEPGKVFIKKANTWLDKQRA